MDDKQIEHMVNRFLGWHLPDDFSPDAGISFKPLYNEHLPISMRHSPIGTNLLTAIQATEMVRYMIDGMPDDRAEPAGLRELQRYDVCLFGDPFQGHEARMEPTALGDYVRFDELEAALANTEPSADTK